MGAKKQNFQYLDPIGMGPIPTPVRIQTLLLFDVYILDLKLDPYTMYDRVCALLAKHDFRKKKDYILFYLGVFQKINCILNGFIRNKW